MAGRFPSAAGGFPIAPRRALAALILVAALTFVGCGGGGGGGTSAPGTTTGTTSTTPTSPQTPQTASVVFTFPSVMAPVDLATIDSIRFSGVDVSGNVVYGPVVKAKAHSITLDDVPVTVVNFRIEYLKATVADEVDLLSVSLSGGSTATVNDPQNNPATSVLTSISITPATPSVAAGLSLALHATGTFSDGKTQKTQDLTATSTWSSSDGSLATVSNAAATVGQATGVKVGAPTISATAGGITGSVNLTVTAAVLDSLAVTPGGASLAKGVSRQFTATGTFSDKSTQDLSSQVAWSTTAGTGSASVSSTGLVTALSAGTATITATLRGISGSIGLTVTAATLSSIAVTPTNPSIAKGLTKQFTATGRFSDTSTQDLSSQVTWTTSDNTVATVSSAGLATGSKVGSATITATLSGVSGNTTLTVTAAVVSSIQVMPTNPSLPLGTTRQLAATATLSDTTTQDVTATASWTSSDNTIASVSDIGGSKGLVTSVAPGSANIVATLNGIQGQTTVTVTPAALVSIGVTPTNPSVVAGLTENFVATGTYSDNTTKPLTTNVTWSSSNTAAATISNAGGSQGVATALAAGSSTITATDPTTKVAGSTTLTVSNATLTGITISPTGASVAKGLTVPFTATGTYDNNLHPDITTLVTWSVTNGTGAATVSNVAGTQGQATGTAVGTVTISATLSGKSASTTLTVTAAALESIAVTPAAPSVAKGLTEPFTATGTYSDSTQADITASVTWTSSNTGVATIVPTTGLATTVGVGTTTISAALSGKTGSTTLTVTAAVVQSLSVTPATTSVGAGSSVSFTATGTFSDSSMSNVTTQVTWSSSNTGIAAISNAPGTQGQATGVSGGTVTITATDPTTSVKGTAQLTVTAQQQAIQFGPQPLFDPIISNESVAGRVTALLADPSDARVILAGTAGGGVWRTDDGGASWKPLTDSLNDTIGCLARDPNNSNTIYAGTGEANEAGDNLAGAGILKSTDGGRTFSLLSGSDSTFFGTAISNILVRPGDSNTILVSNLYSPGAQGLNPFRGVFRSTDGGATFTQTLFKDVSGMASNPTAPDTVYAGVVNDASGSVYRSLDGGKTWTALANGMPPNAVRVSVAVAPSSASVVYATLTNHSNKFDGLYASSDSGTTWSVIPANVVTSDITAYGADESFYDAGLAVDPTNAARVYIGNVNAFRMDNINIAAKTASGFQLSLGFPEGSTFPPANQPHVDHHAFAFDANQALVDGTDGGVFRLASPTVPTGFSQATWADLNGSDPTGAGDLATIQFYGIALHPTNAGIAFGGSQDNGVESFSDHLKWTEVNTGDGAYSFVDPSNPSVVYTETQFGSDFFDKSVDGGRTFSQTSPSGVNLADTAQFHTPFDIHPTQDGHIVLATSHVYESTDGGASFTDASSGALPSDNSGLTAVAYGPSTAVVYAGTDNGQIYVRVTAGGFFRSHSSGLPTQPVSHLAVDFTDATGNTAYATIGAFGTGKIFKTTNGLSSSATWTDITGNLPNSPAHAVALSGSTIFVGNEVGVFASTNGGTSWSSYLTGLPHAAVFDLKVASALNILGIGTHGRGMWEEPLGSGTISPPPPQPARRIPSVAYPIPAPTPRRPIAPVAHAAPTAVVGGPRPAPSRR